MANKKKGGRRVRKPAGEPAKDRSVVTSGPRGKTYPWALLADCVLVFIFLFVNNWVFNLEVQLYFAIGAAVIFIAAMLKKSGWRLLFQNISAILVVLLAQCLFYFIGLFYAVYPKFALQQFLINAGAVFVFATVYVSVLRNEANTEKLTLWFSAAVAIASLVSIELATGGYLKGFFTWIAGVFNARIPTDYAYFEANTRITTVLGTPNVYAPLAVIAMFLSLWSGGRGGRRSLQSLLHMAMALVNGTAFILCFSLGTILAYGAVLLVYLLVSAKEDRGALLFRHVFCIVISLVISALVYVVKDMGVLPLCAVIVLSLLAALAYAWLRPATPKGGVREGGDETGASSRRWAIPVAAVLCAVVVVVLALTLRGDYPLKAGASFRRAVALKPGSYSLRLDFGGQDAGATAAVDVSSMSYAEAALKIKTPLLAQEVTSGQEAQFTVPEESAAVFVNIRAHSDLVATNAVISGGGTAVNLPLKYRILPEFIVNRLQGLWVNDNAIQRFIFFRDGIRLGMKSPVFGLGGGAYEGGLQSVNDYYYTTKHVHNEPIQRFIDGGIIGLLLFLALPVAVFRCLVISRKSEKMRRYYPQLFALMTMIFLHALIEVDFLMISFRATSSLLFALVPALGSDALPVGAKAGRAVRWAFGFVFASALVLALGRYSADAMFRRNPTLESVDNAVWMDPFNSADYKLSFIAATRNTNDPRAAANRQKYLKSMENTLVGADFLAEYYLTSTTEAIKGTEKAEAYIRENRSNVQAWNNIFALYKTVLDSVDPFSDTALIVKASFRNLSRYLEELNGTLPIKITPDKGLYEDLMSAAGKKSGEDFEE